LTFLHLNWHVLTFFPPIWFCMVTYWAPVELRVRVPFFGKQIGGWQDDGGLGFEPCQSPQSWKLPSMWI
jgi:hypothetical protein